MVSGEAGTQTAASLWHKSLARSQLTAVRSSIRTGTLSWTRGLPRSPLHGACTVLSRMPVPQLIMDGCPVVACLFSSPLFVLASLKTRPLAASLTPNHRSPPQPTSQTSLHSGVTKRTLLLHHDLACQESVRRAALGCSLDRVCRRQVVGASILALRVLSLGFMEIVFAIFAIGLHGVVPSQIRPRPCTASNIVPAWDPGDFLDLPLLAPLTPRC